jgi:hypothetical protein
MLRQIFVFFQRKLIFKLVHFVWQKIRLREKIVLFRELLPHQHQVFAQFILVSNNLNAWPLGYTLVWLKFIQYIRCNSEIKPTNIKLFRLRLLEITLLLLRVWVDIETWLYHFASVIKYFSSVLNYLILRVKYVD